MTKIIRGIPIFLLQLVLQPLNTLSHIILTLWRIYSSIHLLALGYDRRRAATARQELGYDRRRAAAARLAGLSTVYVL